MLIFNFLIIIFNLILLTNSLLHSISESNKTSNILAIIENDIFRGNYDHADRLLLHSGLDMSVIRIIVHYLYLDVKINAFEVSTKYAMATKNVKITYFTLEQLYHQMKNSPRLHLDELCEIYKIYTKKIINSTELNKILIKKAKFNLKEIHPKIVNEAAVSIKYEFLRNKLTQMNWLLDEILAANEKLSDDVICKIINETYDIMPFKKLIESMWNLEQTSQKSAALICIFWSLYENFNNNFDNFMIIANYLTKLKNLVDYEVLPDYKLNKIEKIIQKFPLTLKTLYFADRICIRNFETQKMIASNLRFDNYKHSTFTKPYKSENGEEIWYVKFIDSLTFNFVNQKYQNEYLYSGYNTDMNMKSNRLVFTWLVINYPNDFEMKKQLQWRIKFNSNIQTVTIANEAFDNELLCSIEGYKISYEYKNRTNTINNPVVLVNLNSYNRRCHWTMESC